MIRGDLLMITEQIIITVITASASIVAAVIANIAAMSRTSQKIDTQIALIEQKIDQLSVRVEKHNNVIERMYKLEGEVIKKEVEN